VAFFAEQTHPTASNVAFQSPRGRFGGCPAFKRGSRVFRCRGGGFGNRTDFSNNLNKGEFNSIVVCFSCNQDTRPITYPTNGMKTENNKEMTVSTRTVPPFGVSHHNSVLFSINRTIGLQILLP
jgi:hypothetical protein